MRRKKSERCHADLNGNKSFVEVYRRDEFTNKGGSRRPENVVKTGSIFMGRGRAMGRGSAESRAMGSVGAWLRGMVEEHG